MLTIQLPTEEDIHTGKASISINVYQRAISCVCISVKVLWAERVGHDGIRLKPPSQGGIIPAGAHLVQPYCTIKPRSGKEPVGEGDGQGAGEDLPIGVVLHATHPSTSSGQALCPGGVADGHGGAEHVAVDVVEAAVHAGGEALAVGALIHKGHRERWPPSVAPAHVRQIFAC